VTAKQTLDGLADFFADGPALEAATCARPAQSGAPPEVRSLSLAADAEAYFRTVVEDAVIDRIDEWSLKQFDPLYKPDSGELEWLDVSDVDAVALAVDRYENLSPYAPFDPTDGRYKRKLQYWTVVLTHPDGRKAFFFRAFTAAAELERKRGAALVSRLGTFHRVEERIFLFDDAIDCFAFGDYVYVIRKRDYRRIFDQLEEIKRRARRAAGDLNQKVPIANFDAFENACSTDSRMADKVLAVRQRDYFERLSYEMLKPVIDEFDLRIPTEQSDGIVRLVFRTEPDQRFRILKLVDDDYLASSMTDHLYEVNSKTAPPSN
jgi:hypothetical protein